MIITRTVFLSFCFFTTVTLTLTDEPNGRGMEDEANGRGRPSSIYMFWWRRSEPRQVVLGAAWGSRLSEAGPGSGSPIGTRFGGSL